METRIGIVTFSKFVYCYDWSSTFDSMVCFGVSKEFQYAELTALLAVEDSVTGDGRSVTRKYMTKVKQNKDTIIRRIKKIKAEGDILYDNDPDRRCRALRAYGQALCIALSVCELSKLQCRIINTLGGPCTHGVGKVIGTSFKKHMRSI